MKTTDRLPNVAVLLIDMQDEFVAELRKGAKDTIVPQQLKVIDWCAKHDIPLIAIAMRPAELGPIIPELDEAIKKVPRLTQINKQYDNAFRCTKLEKILRQLKAQTLVLMGINADHCVRDTAKHARSLGYNIITARDLIAGQEHHSSDDSAYWFSTNGTLCEQARQLAAIFDTKGP